jgi:hypothetical protein
MAHPLRRLLHRWRYGEPVVVVSGLPRSGTSMMMKMLQGGGLELVTDGVREADEDNPKGYFELERVKNLENDADKAWVSEGRGKVLKVISHLLKDLPDTCAYKVVLMRRDLNEVVASQNKMLEHRGEENPIEDAKVVELYRKHLIHAKVMMRERPNYELLEVQYADSLAHPSKVAKRVNAFLGGGLDLAQIEAAIDPSLYRNRTS